MAGLHVLPRVHTTERNRNDVIDLETQRIVLRQRVVNLAAAQRTRISKRAQPPPQPTLSCGVLPSSITVEPWASHRGFVTQPTIRRLRAWPCAAA
ncbi:hypothetical protein [Mycolicibacterium elephantis]